MSAVILGISALTSALAANKQANVQVCHLGGQTTADPADDLWTVILVSATGA